MAKREPKPTRAQKIEAAKKAGVETKKPTPRRQNGKKPEAPTSVVTPKVPIQQDQSKVTPADNVTSMVARAGKPKLVASYAQILAHRKPVIDKVKGVVKQINASYAESDRDDRDAQHERYELADTTLDWLIDLFDHNGYSNPGDRLVFAWLMFDLLRPIGHRTIQVCDLVEKTFHLRGQVLSDKGLGSEIKHRREQQKKRREQQGDKSSGNRQAA